MPTPNRNIRPNTPMIVVSRVIVESSNIDPSIINEPVTARIL